MCCHLAFVWLLVSRPDLLHLSFDDRVGVESLLLLFFDFITLLVVIVAHTHHVFEGAVGFTLVVLCLVQPRKHLLLFVLHGCDPTVQVLAPFPFGHYL